MIPGSSRDIEIFIEALQLPAEERVDFLNQACGSDEVLRRKINALLKSNEKVGIFLEQPPAMVDEVRGKTEVWEKSGDQIDRYKLLRQIGEGGCGIVFLAEQQTPVLRHVAVKVVKPGMDTKSVIARFEAERQALALMDHPHIAHIIDAGVADSGRPYFVMEWVEGIKITDYCDKYSLPIKARLELFAQVCDAIQHAHQKGIIHRDIKPSNILVTTGSDGKPVPKVIDFGIAKAMTGLKLTDKTFLTSCEMIIGTPAYMSPEQAALTSTDMDTRTDVYSLGVLLYEMLTGTTPFDANKLLKAGFDEVRRVIREEEPVRPSTRLGAMLAAELANVSSRHGAEAPKLIREMRGDLDWIVMKALEKDRTRRYATSNGLAMDVQRYLSGEAVLAHAPSTAYKLQKLFLRNRPVFIGLGLIFLLLVIALAVTTRLFIMRQRGVRLSIALQWESKANSYISESKLAEAEAALRESLAIRKRYLDGEPPTEEMLKDVVNGMAIAQRRLEAIELLNQILTPAVIARPECVDPISWRGELSGQFGMWQTAAADAALLVKRQPDNKDWYHMLAPLLVATTNRNAYENLCTNILAHFGNTTNFVVADQMAKDCLILPSTGVDLKAVSAMTDLAVTKGKGHPAYHFFQCGHALAQYRLGNFDEAVTWAEASATNSFPYSQAEAYAVIAMAQYKLGREADARQGLTNCSQIIENKLPPLGKNLRFDWRDWIIAHALHEEADNLINRREP